MYDNEPNLEQIVMEDYVKLAKLSWRAGWLKKLFQINHVDRFSKSRYLLIKLLKLRLLQKNLTYTLKKLPILDPTSKIKYKKT